MAPRTLPPTACLRAFEVCTRHGTFTSAADELSVTQSAVSHQIRHLENIWGVTLFERGTPLRLTASGAALAPLVREFFVKLDTTLGSLHEQQGRIALTVSTTYSFSLKWLLPRLPTLAVEHPDLVVTLDPSDRIIHFTQDDPEVAIRLGAGHYPSLYSEFLFRETIFPVASPDLIKRFGYPRSPAELLRYPLLMRDGSDLVPKWERWFQQVGVQVSALKGSVLFADTNMTIEAALLGQGVAMARSGHVERELAQGQLVRLFNVPFESPIGYYFVCPRGVESKSHVEIFRAWLRNEAAGAAQRYA